MTKPSNDLMDVSNRIKDPQCNVQELAALVGICPENDRLIAAHSNAGSESLRKLSKSEDKKTRELVASNPNTPVNVLLYLADDFPRAFLVNPAFDIIVLEDPGALERLFERTLAIILEQKECPQSIIEWAYKSYKKKNSFSSSTVLLGLVKNPYTPVKIIKSILKMRSKNEITCQEAFL